MDDQRAKGGEGFVARWSRRKTEVKEKLGDQGIEELKEEKFTQKEIDNVLLFFFFFANANKSSLS